MTIEDVRRQWCELNGLPAESVPMADGVPPANCWTCDHRMGDCGCDRLHLREVCTWADANCDYADSMPPRDATGCPGYERADHGETTEAEDRFDAMVRFLDSDEARKELESGALMGGPIARRNIITRWQERKQALDAANDALSRIASALGMEDASAQEVAQEVERAADARKTGRLYVDVALLEQAQRERDEARAELAIRTGELASVTGSGSAPWEAAALMQERDKARAELASVRKERDACRAEWRLYDEGFFDAKDGRPSREADSAYRTAYTRGWWAGNGDEARAEADRLRGELSTIADLAGFGHVEPWPGVVEAVRRITDSHAALVVERERVAAFVHDMAFDGALDARDGIARGWDVLERLSDVAQAGADALAAAAAEWGER